MVVSIQDSDATEMVKDLLMNNEIKDWMELARNRRCGDNDSNRHLTRFGEIRSLQKLSCFPSLHGTKLAGFTIALFTGFKSCTA